MKNNENNKLRRECKAEFRKTLSKVENKHDYILNVLKDQQNFEANNNAPFNFYISNLSELCKLFGTTKEDIVIGKLWGWAIYRREVEAIFDVNKTRKK